MYKKLYHNNNSSVTDSTKYTNNMQNKQNTESYTQKVNFTIINQNNQQKNPHKKTNINDILFENFNKPPQKLPSQKLPSLPPSQIPPSQIPLSQNIENFNTDCTSSYVGNYSTTKDRTSNVKQNTDINPLDPKAWGPHGWAFMEAIVFHYPDNPTPEEKQAALNFFDSLMLLLPCEKCRKHYIENRKVLKINVSSKDKLSRWLVDFHNEVNKMLGKTEWKYEDVSKKYQEECQECKI